MRKIKGKKRCSELFTSRKMHQALVTPTMGFIRTIKNVPRKLVRCQGGFKEEIGYKKPTHIHYKAMSIKAMIYYKI